MAPGKKRKEKGNVEGSSSSANVNRFRFWNETAVNNYTLLLNKSMPRERGFDLEHPNRPLIVQAVNNHWRNFIRTPSVAVIPVVREFYANLRVKHEDFKVRVRGKLVPFDAKTINGLYELPEIEDDEYTTFRQEPVEYDEIIGYLCYPGATWRLNANGHVVTFKANFLKQAAAAVFLFVIARLMPAKHSTDVTKERAILVYCILKGMSINVGKIIQASILHAARTNMNISMPHSSLISELCQSSEAIWDEDEEMLMPQVPIKVPTRRTMDADDGPAAEPSGSTSQQAAAPRRPRSLHRRMDAIEHKVDNLSLNNSNFMSYVVDFNTALAHRFTHPDQQHPQFPDPPEWRDADDDDEENDEGDDEDDEH